VNYPSKAKHFSAVMEKVNEWCGITISKESAERKKLPFKGLLYIKKACGKKSYGFKNNISYSSSTKSRATSLSSMRMARHKLDMIQFITKCLFALN